jgi:hypothetical protein
MPGCANTFWSVSKVGHSNRRVVHSTYQTLEETSRMSHEHQPSGWGVGELSRMDWISRTSM